MGKRPILKYEKLGPSPEKRLQGGKEVGTQKPGWWAETRGDPWPIPALACRRAREECLGAKSRESRDRGGTSMHWRWLVLVDRTEQTGSQCDGLGWDWISISQSPGRACRDVISLLFGCDATGGMPCELPPNLRSPSLASSGVDSGFDSGALAGCPELRCLESTVLLGLRHSTRQDGPLALPHTSSTQGHHRIEISAEPNQTGR